MTEKRSRGRQKGSVNPPESRSKRHAFDSKDEDAVTVNERYIEFIRAITPAEPLNYDDIPEMERRFQHYLDMCKLYNMKVGNQNAYMAIGIDRKLAYNWLHDRSSPKPHRKAFVEHVQQVCASYREILMQDGKINPVTGIFWQKNFDGYKDQQEIVTVPAPPLGELTDTSAVQQKYLDTVYSYPEIVAEADAKELPDK